MSRQLQSIGKARHVRPAERQNRRQLCVQSGDALLVLLWTAKFRFDAPSTYGLMQHKVLDKDLLDMDGYGAIFILCIFNRLICQFA